MKFHYTYRITNMVTNMHYYGSKSCDTKPKENLGIEYFSSFGNKFFEIDQKINRQDYKYKIIKEFDTRELATKLEIKLHKKFNVTKHESFINRANQTSSGFIFDKKHSEVSKKKISDTKRKFPRRFSEEEKSLISRRMKSNNPMYQKETREKLSKTLTGRMETEETKKKKSKTWLKKSKNCELNCKPMFGDDNPSRRVDVREKISKNRKGKGLGPMSKEQKEKISKSSKGRKLKRVKCQYCHKEVTVNTIERFHNENCKQKK